MAEASALPSPSAAHAASAGPTTVTREVGSGAAGTPTNEVDGALPAGLTPEQARGQCAGRAELATARGPVSCYPYRCRNGRCLRSCNARSDCAGSDGPADFAENGWPLDCADHRCFPLPPDHVHP